MFFCFIFDVFLITLLFVECNLKNKLEMDVPWNILNSDARADVLIIPFPSFLSNPLTRHKLPPMMSTKF